MSTEHAITSVAFTPLAALPFAFGDPPLAGRLRERPEDFQVEEVLDIDPDGAGEHALLRVRKTGLNTEEVARILARHAGVHPRDVGWCGLKDRNAVATQWFSVGMAGRADPDWSALASERLHVLNDGRHGRKLRRNAGSGNRFRIRVTAVEGDRDLADTRLAALSGRGAPNYFGVQRFGRGYDNLARAERLFQGTLKGVRPHLRGLYLSAARSQLFNEVLARRVARGNWNEALPGDLMQLDGSRSWFVAEVVDTEIRRRVAEMDIHPTGPLWGRGALPGKGEPAALEAAVGEGFAAWCRGLEGFGLDQERRGLRMRVSELTWHWTRDALEVAFRLASGCFATVVLRELVREPAAAVRIDAGAAPSGV
jgi:tRNA pseudouridine13 synthase